MGKIRENRTQSRYGIEVFCSKDSESDYHCSRYHFLSRKQKGVKMKIRTSITGFPRIGEKRELKKALENYWAGKTDKKELLKVASDLRRKHWSVQKDKGIDLISCNDFSLYDNMLDTAVMLAAVPARFKNIADPTERYFAMARGNSSCSAMEMTKWFNTNYHYIVPELSPDDTYSLDCQKITSEYNEALSLGIKPKINIIGPVTFLGLSTYNSDKDILFYFEKIMPVYKELFTKLAELDDEVIVQLEEPIFVRGGGEKELSMLRKECEELASVSGKIRIIAATYFEHSNEATEVLCDSPVWGIGLDFTAGIKNLENIKSLNGKKLFAGVVDGRNIWRNDFEETSRLLEKITEKVPEEDIVVTTGCSLLHVPYSVSLETGLENYTSWLSFAIEKLDEVRIISRIFSKEKLTDKEDLFIRANRRYVAERKESDKVHSEDVKNRISSLKKLEREGSFRERNPLQRKKLLYPLLATTTIGSYPQTKELRKLRSDFKNKHISTEEYEKGIKDYINNCIEVQEKIGLDILVHGEPERNDMVEYFGEMLEGFLFTQNGWVQSYGSRCVKPPVIFGDIQRPFPMTVKWITYAQSRTEKTVKGMLTGPVTILHWSFVRDDIPGSEVSRQIALALSDEIRDLQNAGIKIIQVDEAAFKEGYPLRKENHALYEKWAVDNFKLAVSTAEKETQIHTHMCYSQFNDIIKTIERMDADVITIETARSGNKLLKVFRDTGYQQEIGPGVYDIHSPRVPSVSEIAEQIKSILEVIPKEQLWINPDCGLKTRKWEEVIPSLQNMTEAVKQARESF